MCTAWVGVHTHTQCGFSFSNLCILQPDSHSTVDGAVVLGVRFLHPTVLAFHFSFSVLRVALFSITTLVAVVTVSAFLCN